MGTLWQDMRYAVRVLAKSPGFTLVAVAALALGVGANTAIFSVVNAVLLRPLPYPEAERLVRVGGTSPKRADQIGTLSPQDFYDWRAENRSFESISAYDSWSPALTGDGEPERVNAARVSFDFFSTLRTPPATGRAFLPEEERRGRHRVVVLGDGLWRRRFGSDPSVVGRRIELNGEPFEVVGVAPRGFESPQFGGADWEAPELWAPFAPDLTQWTRSGRAVDACVARLKEGVTEAEALAEMRAIAARLEAQYPETNKNSGVLLASLHEQLVGGTRTALLVFLVAVGFVLLIACANVANLMLARSSARRKEFAVRTALGATRWRLARQLLTESLLLALGGGAAGLLLAWWASDALLVLGSDFVPRLAGAGLDWRVLGFTLAASVLTGLLFGLAPALHSTRLDLNETLKEGGRDAGSGAARSRARSALVVAEVALSLALLVGAGLLARSFARLVSVDPGFRPEGAVAMNVFLPGARYPEDAQHVAFFEGVLERVAALPGVAHAGATSNLPVSGNFDRTSVYAEGHPSTDSTGDTPDAERYVVSADYFGAVGVPLLRGRGFTEADREGAPLVAVVGRTMAERFWPGQDVIGRRVKFGEEKNPWVTIVGVAGDVRHYGLDKEANMQFYLHHRQYSSQFMTLVVRADSGTDAEALAAPVRAQVWEVDAGQPVYGVQTLSRLVADSTGQRRFNTLVVGLFAALALALALVGVYGVMSYTVTQRTHEIGVRMALGARPRTILRMVVGQGMWLALAGVSVGLASAFALTRLMSGLLYGVSATDPATFAAASALLTLVALLACYLPARRATRVDPMRALRHE